MYGLRDVVPGEAWVRLGYCDDDGRPRYGHGMPGRYGFWPTDDDVADALTDEAVADAVGEAIGRHEAVLRDLVQQHPRATAMLSNVCPEAVAKALLAHSRDIVDAQLPKLAERPPILLSWRRTVDRPATLPAPLASAAVVADGIAGGLAHFAEIGSGRMRAHDADPDDQGVATVERLVVAALMGWSHTDLERAGAKSALVEAAHRHPDDWARVLPWVLQVVPSAVVTEVSLRVAAAGFDLLSALESAVDLDIEPLRLRSLGLIGLLAGEDDANLLVGKLASLVDRDRTGFPRPLAEPTSTWMSDLELEDGLRSAIRAAVAGFKREFVTQARAEEEGHVASLMTRVEERLRVLSTTRSAGGSAPGQPVELTAAYRRIPKNEEHRIYADLAVVIDVDIYAHLRGTFADFIQVKKSRLTTASATSADSWTVDMEQLTGLVEVSATAVYWLIGADGEVLVVPAKLVLALAEGQRKTDQGTFTLHYAAVRHAAIGLESYLIDLTTGGWVGSSTAPTTTLAQGGADGTTRAHALFELSLRYSPG